MAGSINIMIGGEAGQGLVTIGEVLGTALVRSGYSIVVTKSYQSRIRGGHNTFSIRAGAEEIHAPRETVDLLVALNEETVRLHLQGLSEKGMVLADEKWETGCPRCIRLPFRELAKSSHVNTVALGAVAAVLGLDRKIICKLLEERLGAKKGPEVVRKNEEAIGKIYDFARENPAGFDAPSPPESPTRRLVLDGNKAMALGAISAGLRFYSFYPMTPATSMALSLIEHADEAGIVVEQAEDEIAAINMAIGASYAGAPSMVGTSGGGFALMVEGVSLAAMTETPVVVVVAQRPGPATGLPTRTEQADLDFVLHSGHGEFPRAVFAPSSVEDCFYLARKALELAERYQSPAFILTDQFLADTMRAVKPFDLEGLGQISAGDDPGEVPENYARFMLTEDGISPRLLPGASGKLVVVDSDEHDERGHITEDFHVRRTFVEKRLRKHEGLLKETLPPDFDGRGQPDILFVTWGSSAGSVREAAAELESRGVKSATLCFKQVWPLLPAQFVDYLKEARRLVCVEGNARGQFARLLQGETGYELAERILRYDGLPITPEFILERIEV